MRRSPAQRIKNSFQPELPFKPQIPELKFITNKEHYSGYIMGRGMREMPESDVKSILKDAWKKTSEPGDKICFYATGNGVIADATVSSFPEKKFDPAIHDLDRYPWVFRLEAGKICLDNPVIIDAALRANLDAFKGRDPNKPWACFVQSTGKLSKHDFDVHREN